MTNRETVLRPSSRVKLFNIREIFEYRDLLYLLIRRDFLARYKQTILGPAWAVIQPVATALVFTFVFGKVARLPTDDAPPFLFYLSGMLFWQLFSSSVQAGGSQLQDNGPLFSKVYFPRIIPSIGVQVSQLIPFAIQIAILGLFCLWYYLGSDNATFHAMRLLWLPVLLLLVCILSLAVSIGLSAMTAKYRDLKHALGFLIQLGLYLTPVIYSMSSVPEHWRWAVWLNPMAGPVSAAKWIFLDAGDFPAWPLAWSAMTAVILLLLSMNIFQRVQRTFVDTV